MKHVKSTALGVLVGLMIGGPLVAHAATPEKPRHTYVGDGFYIDCRSNGPGGYRSCDMHVRNPGAVDHMVVRMFESDEWLMSVNVRGLNTSPVNHSDMDADVATKVRR